MLPTTPPKKKRMERIMRTVGILFWITFLLSTVSAEVSYVEWNTSANPTPGDIVSVRVVLHNEDSVNQINSFQEVCIVPTEQLGVNFPPLNLENLRGHALRPAEHFLL